MFVARWISRFGGKVIRVFSWIYTRNPSLRKRWNGCTAVAFIPFDPGASVENPRCMVIQCRFEISVAEVLPEDFNVLIRSVRHRIGEKAGWEFKRVFWSSKPEDVFRNNQKFVRVNHRSLPSGAKSSFPTSTGNSSNFTSVAAVRNAFCREVGSLGRIPRKQKLLRGITAYDQTYCIVEHSTAQVACIMSLVRSPEQPSASPGYFGAAASPRTLGSTLFSQSSVLK